jgi:hypothetical protein
MARVEIKEWFRNCVAQRAFAQIAQTSPSSPAVTWTNGPDILPVDRWDGTTLYEVTQTWTDVVGSPSSGNLRGEYTIKYASNSTDHLTPVVGAGTGYLELTLQQLMEYLYRAKLLRAVADLEYSGTLSSTATSSLLAMAFEFEVETDARNNNGTQATTLAARTENQIYCGGGFNRWASVGQTPNYFASMNYDIDESPDEFFIGTGTGNIILNPNTPSYTSDLGGAVIRVRAADNPQVTAYQIADEPEVYFVPANQIWPLLDAACQCMIRSEGQNSIGGNFSLRSGLESPLIAQALRSVELTEEYYDDDWFLRQINSVEILTGLIDFSFFGEPVNDPGLRKGTASLRQFETDTPVATNNTTVAGSVDIEAQEYWEYTDDDGNPLYDKDTGAQL